MKKLVLIASLYLFMQPMYAQSSVCRLLNNIPKSVKIIKDSAHRLFSHNTDDCVFMLIDSLQNRFIKTHKTDYLVCLDSICWNCSDVVGEMFMDTNLFYKCFKPYIDYLYKNGDTINCLEINLENGFGFEFIDDPNDLYDAKKHFENFIKEQESMYKFPTAEKDFIEGIKKRVEAITMDDKE
jgi:hypothetical protein